MAAMGTQMLNTNSRGEAAPEHEHSSPPDTGAWTPMMLASPIKTVKSLQVETSYLTVFSRAPPGCNTVDPGLVSCPISPRHLPRVPCLTVTFSVQEGGTVYAFLSPPFHIPSKSKRYETRTKGHRGAGIVPARKNVFEKLLDGADDGWVWDARAEHPSPNDVGWRGV